MDSPICSLAVLGIGLIGGSILKTNGQGVGWDFDATTRKLATEQGFVVKDTAAEALQDSDIVVVAVPPSAGADVVCQALNQTQNTVLDVCSVKASIVKQVLTSNPQTCSRYVPCHPLAGAATSGWQSSTDTLLQDAPWAVCPHANIDPWHLWQAIGLVTKMQGYVIGCLPEVHDEVVAYASHATQLVASVLAAYAPEHLSSSVAAFHGGGLRDATRIASSDPLLWRSIIANNQMAVGSALDQIITELAAVRDQVRDGDWSGIEQTIARGQHRKQLLDQTRWSDKQWSPQTWNLDQLTAKLLETGQMGYAVRWSGPASKTTVPVLVGL